MIISFDLDDTLIPGVKSFETERQNLLQKIFGLEKIRVGTVPLMKTLQSKGHKIFIYTSSLRSVNRIWYTFYLYGIKLDKVINRHVHEKSLKQDANQYSKYPPAFSIDIHVDDSKGVEMEGSNYHFRTIIIEENTLHWTDFVLQRVLKYPFD